MNFYHNLVILFLLSLSRPLFSCVGGKGFFPENNWKVPVKQKTFRGISEARFNSIINNVKEIYEPIIRAKGARLSIERRWEDSTVNAYASRRGSEWIIQMFGGLARHNEITEDGFTLVLCHEIGHHIGGVPRYTESNSWASNEGQSDYFAATKCLRRLWHQKENQAIISRMRIPDKLKLECEDEWGNSNDQALCMRIGMAGLSTSRMFAVLSNNHMPQFETPDLSNVQRTLDSHPPYQCRLDTYFHGGLCLVDFEQEIGQEDPNVGTCSRENLEEKGSRRTCWYRPLLNDPTPPHEEKSQAPTVNGRKLLKTNNPNKPIPLDINLSYVPNTVSVVLEASKPDRSFSNPNDLSPDPKNSLGYIILRGTQGVYKLIPSKSLPRWGTYQFRVLPLDRERNPILKFSDPFTLELKRN